MNWKPDSNRSTCWHTQSAPGLAIEVHARQVRVDDGRGSSLGFWQCDAAVEQCIAQGVVDLSGIVAMQPGKMNNVLAVITRY